MLKKTLTKVIKRWRDEDVKLVLPYSEQHILNSFVDMGSLISKDILELYNTSGGMIDGEIDSVLLSFWSLEQIVKENSSKISEYTFFADFLIYSHIYGFKYENTDVSSIYCNYETREFVKIADSVEEFFDLYLKNPNTIGLFQE